MFTLQIKTSGAAFGETTDDAVYEVNRILTEVKRKLHVGYTEGSINDINGNKVCTFKLEGDE